jgi:hypothetical protein
VVAACKRGYGRVGGGCGFARLGWHVRQDFGDRRGRLAAPNAAIIAGSRPLPPRSCRVVDATAS